MRVTNISCPPTHARASFPGDTGETYPDKSHNYDGCNVTHRTAEFSLHSGTHVDAPAHVRMDGKPFDEAHCNGQAVVLDVRSRPVKGLMIRREDIHAAIERIKATAQERRGIKALLLRTGYINEDPFLPHDPTGFPYPEQRIIEELRTQFPEVRVIGIDIPSVDAKEVVSLANERHGDFFNNGIAPLECLRFPADFEAQRGYLAVHFDPSRTGPDATGVHATFIE